MHLQGAGTARIVGPLAKAAKQVSTGGWEAERIEAQEVAAEAALQPRPHMSSEDK